MLQIKIATKRATVTLLTVMLLLLFTACGGSGTPSRTNASFNTTATPDTMSAAASTANTPENLDEAVAQLESSNTMRIYRSGTYSIRFSVTVSADDSNENSTSERYVCVDGGKSYEETTSESAEGERTIIMIYKDGLSYGFNVQERTYSVYEVPDGEQRNVGFDYIEKLQPSGFGSAVVAGMTLPYVEYIRTENGAIERWYLAGGELFAIETVQGKWHTVNVVTEVTETVPDGIFEVPAGYAEVSE